MGLVAYMTGTRPSELIGWSDIDEWQERLLFDTMILEPIAKIVFPPAK